jgi:hypothetical protein
VEELLAPNAPSRAVTASLAITKKMLGQIAGALDN